VFFRWGSPVPSKGPLWLAREFPGVQWRKLLERGVNPNAGITILGKKGRYFSLRAERGKPE